MTLSIYTSQHFILKQLDVAEVKQDNDCLVTTKASDDAVSIAGSHCLSVTSHHSVQCKSDALLDVKSATTNSHSHSGKHNASITMSV